MTNDLYSHLCQTPLCINKARHWDGRLIVAGTQREHVSGYCADCGLRRCDDCSWQVPADDADWAEHPNAAAVNQQLQETGMRPFWLHCLYCGTRLGSTESQQIRIFIQAPAEE